MCTVVVQRTPDAWSPGPTRVRGDPADKFGSRSGTCRCGHHTSCWWVEGQAAASIQNVRENNRGNIVREKKILPINQKDITKITQVLSVCIDSHTYTIRSISTDIMDIVLSCVCVSTSPSARPEVRA